MRPPSSGLFPLHRHPGWLGAMPFAVAPNHRPFLTALHVSLFLRDCLALQIAGLKAVLRTGHRMPKKCLFQTPPFSGFSGKVNFLVTLIRRLDDVAMAFRSLLPAFERRHLDCSELTAFWIGIGSDES